MFGKRFRNLIIGRQNYIDSWLDYKNAVFRGNLILLSILVGIVYLLVDWVNNITGNEWYYVAAILIGVVSLYLNRLGKHKLSSILFMFLINVLVFLFASNDQYRSGVYIFFVVAAMSSIAIFGHRQKYWAFGFVSFSIALFFLSYWGGISIQPKRTYSEAYISLNFAINFMIAMFSVIAQLYFLIAINNKTEQEILAKNELLAKTNSELDRFVYSASHDLRAPLRSLLGLIEVTQRTANPEELEQCFALMKDRVHNMDVFIKEIIDFSRNARQAVKKETIDLFGIIQETINDLKFAEGMEQIYVRLDVPPEYKPTTDKARLKVVLHNLIGNAFKYHDPGKEMQEVSIRVVADGVGTRIEIADNGLGIAEEHHEKIFEMFFRASEQSNGSGLGLYIVKETLARLNGKIELKSTRGEGSVFTVYLPE
ncbi:MAG: HAMP domain-containing histidine kinase [Cyclobacteriaceae bacterium]|nr:HAMP domain-containing histidine kinase [Cyclobacteriaceae bacterium]